MANQDNLLCSLDNNLCNQINQDNLLSSLDSLLKAINLQEDNLDNLLREINHQVDNQDNRLKSNLFCVK